MKRWQELEQAVEKLLTVKGYRFWRVSNYRCFRCGQVQNAKAIGMPDYVVWYPKVFYIECKTGASKLSPEQQEVKMLSKGRFILVRNNVDELINYIEKTL